MLHNLRAEYVKAPGGYRAIVVDDYIGKTVVESVIVTNDKQTVVQEAAALSFMVDDSLLKRWDVAHDGALFKAH